MTIAAQAAPVVHGAPAGMPVALRVERLSKRFPVRRGWREMLRHPRERPFATALDGVSFEVRGGEFFALLGPNGAGKSTLFRILSTLVPADEGRATVEGHDVGRDAARVRRVVSSVTTEERSLSWRLSARENLALFAALHDLRGAAKWRRVDEVLECTELADTGNKMVGQFSSGMKQRLLLARALLSRPRVLLLDEPTRSLDPISARRFRAFLREEIGGRQGCTVLIATHNAEEALELCDRVAVLDRGRLRASGTPEELSRRIAGARFRLVTRGASGPVLVELARRGVIRDLVPGETEEGSGWHAVTVAISGGAAGAAAVAGALAAAGVELAALEAVRLPLADLIERVVRDDAAEVPHA
ncbi:MAG TPA: ABC transporter ATP-binding protein [Gemmatimonadaceae bacterium]